MWQYGRINNLQFPLPQRILNHSIFIPYLLFICGRRRMKACWIRADKSPFLLVPEVLAAGD